VHRVAAGTFNLAHQSFQLVSSSRSEHDFCASSSQWSAAARPMPLLAPVIATTLPSMPVILVLLGEITFFLMN